RVTRSRARRASPPAPRRRGRCVGSETDRDRCSSSCERVGLPRLQNRDGGSVPHAPPELLRIGLDQIPGVVMHWDNAFGFHELDSADGIFDSHREVVADRHQHEVDAPGQQLHFERQPGVTGVIDRLAADRHDDTGRVGRVPAGLVAFHPAPVKRGDELHSSKRKLVRSTDVHPVTGGALIGAELRQLVRGDDGRLVFLREGDRIPEVITVAVRQEDAIEMGQLIGSDVGGGIAGEERIDNDAFTVPLEHETGVSVECRFHSPTCFAYASARSSPSNSLGSLIFTLTIQPLPYGSRFTRAGSCSSALLISRIVPATGEYSSDTAFTASIVPKTSRCLNATDAFGSSTNTTSPSSP